MSDRIVVDWTACRGRGTCSELLPERITLDEWGYPIVSGDVPADLLPYARLAVDGCPTRALRLVHSRRLPAPQPMDSSGGHRASTAPAPAVAARRPPAAPRPLASLRPPAALPRRTS